MAASLKRQRTERMLAALAEPATLDDLLEHVSDGGTLSGWVTNNDFRYGYVHQWLHDDAQRLSRYTTALEARTGRMTDTFESSLFAMSQADPRQAFDKSGRPLPVHKLPDGVVAALDSMDVTTNDAGDRVTKLRLVSKGRAAELVGRRLGMFREKIDVDMKVGFADRLRAARLRAATSK